MSKKKKEKKPKEKIKEKIKVAQINLRIARKKDLLELDRYITKGTRKVKKWKMKSPFMFWLINSKGEIENKPYTFKEDIDMREFADWLNREQVLIPA